MATKPIVAMICLLCSVGNGVTAGVPVTKTRVNTLEITEHGIRSLSESSCLSWCMTGVCVWLKCSFPSCHIETTPRFKHNNPDLLVTVFDEIGKDPWTDMNHWTSSIQVSVAKTILGWLIPNGNIGGGHVTPSVVGSNIGDSSRRFKEANAYGHPLTALTGAMSGQFTCPSEAQPFSPYFSSAFDAIEWRMGVGEMLNPVSWLPGVRTIGTGGFFQQWGSVFPRTGFVTQKDDVKAGAVVAQRVGNIVTGALGVHVSSKMSGNGFSWTVLPGELKANEAQTGVWQMVAPKQDSHCYEFGENDVYSTLPWSTGRNSDNNSYAYALWRRYECCEDKGSLIEVIPSNVCI